MTLPRVSTYLNPELCPLVNDCNLLTGFSDFYLLLSHLTPSMRDIPSSCRVHIWCDKTRLAGLQSGEGRMMIGSVVWAQYINVTDRHTDSHVAIANAAPTHCVGRQKLKTHFLRPDQLSHEEAKSSIFKTFITFSTEELYPNFQKRHAVTSTGGQSSLAMAASKL